MKEIKDLIKAKKLTEIEGETRGLNLKHDADYVLKEKGEQGLKTVEKELKKLGCPFEYGQIKGMDFYPIGWKVASLLAIKKVFDLEDQGIRDVCASQPKVSLIVKIFMKYFYSVPEAVKRAPEMWQRYWTIGDLEVVEYNKKERRAVMRIKNFDVPKIICSCVQGYCLGMVGMFAPVSKVRVREVKCSQKGDRYHEFIISWEK